MDRIQFTRRQMIRRSAAMLIFAAAFVTPSIVEAQSRTNRTVRNGQYGRTADRTPGVFRVRPVSDLFPAKHPLPARSWTGLNAAEMKDKSAPSPVRQASSLAGSTQRSVQPRRSQLNAVARAYNSRQAQPYKQPVRRGMWAVDDVIDENQLQPFADSEAADHANSDSSVDSAEENFGVFGTEPNYNNAPDPSMLVEEVEVEENPFSMPAPAAPTQSADLPVSENTEPSPQPENAFFAPVPESKQAAEPAPLPAAIQPPTAKQSVPPAIPGGRLTKKTVAAEIARIQAEQSLEAETKADLIKIYHRANGTIDAAEQVSSQTQQVLSQIQSLKVEVANTSESNAAWQNRQLEDAKNLSQQRLQQYLDQWAGQLKPIQERAKNREAATETLQANRRTIEKQLEELGTTLHKASPQISEDTSAEASLALTMEFNANRQYMMQQGRFLQAQLQMVDHQAIAAKAQAMADDETSRWLTAATESYSDALQVIQTAQAEKAKVETNRLSYDIHPRLQKHADKNVELAERNAELLSLIDDVRYDSRVEKNVLEEILESKKVIKDREAATGLTNTLGLLMRNRRAHLPPLRPMRRRLRNVQAEMENAGDEEMILEDMRDRFAEFESSIDTILSQAEANGEPNMDAITDSAYDLLNQRSELLDANILALQDYTDSLSALGSTTNDLITTTDKYTRYIDEHVLWVRSTHRLGFADLQTGAEAAAHVVQPRILKTEAGAFYESLQDNVIWCSIVGGMVLVLMLFGSEFRTRLRKLGERAAIDQTTKGLVETVEAVAITLLISVQRPVLMYGVGWLMTVHPEVANFSISLGEAVMTTAALYALFEVLRQTCRQGGLAELHFGWSKAGLRQIHSIMPMIMLAGLPMVMAVVFLEKYESGHWKNSLGRIIFIVGMVCLWKILRKLLHPTKGALQLIAAEGAAWIKTTRWVWYVLGNFCPLALAGLAFAGYYYTAEQLSGCLETTFGLALALIVIQALLGRAIDTLRYTTAAKLELDASEVESFEKLEAAKTDRETKLVDKIANKLKPSERLKIHAANRASRSKHKGKSPSVQNAVVGSSETIENNEHHYWDELTSSLQLHRLVQVAVVVILFGGIWQIWSHVLPAMTAVTDFPLWESTQEIAVVAESASASDEAAAATKAADMPAIRKTVFVTLGDVLLAILIASVTFVAARNLPGLMDTCILNRLPIDRGARHAISTIACYVLSVTGVIMAFNAIGIGWGSVQWLVAAMTVGLGFGLQEIFGNFVSGIIILFERPIRIGDFVTVANETGFVQRIQFRATTVMDISRREIIVPNKKFITDELINWTLSDPITRINVPVGVAYGTDTTLVRRLLMEIAEEHPMVMETPEPSAVMLGFGDSTLDFELRCFIPERDGFAEVIHDLATGIDRRFAKYDIEIAFPQRDLNIRGLDALGSGQLKAA